MKKILESINQKWADYLLEILVIILGILGAFTLDNWNEELKEKQFEQKMLSELFASVENNIKYLDEAITRNNDARQSCHLLLNHLNSGFAYQDSLDHHFSASLFWFYPSLDNNAYESLKSYGIHLISNDSIRKKLMEVYEWKFVERISMRQDEYFYGTVAPLLIDWFESYDFFGPMKPLNYEVLRSSSEYKHILGTMISNRSVQIELYEISKKDRISLAEMIKTELDKYD